MPEKMISEMPLPTPRAVICSPSHIRKIVPPVSVMTVVMRKKSPVDHRRAGRAAHAFQADGDAVGLDRGQEHRAVAGVLVDLLAAGLAFLLQRLQRRRRPLVISCMMIEAEMYGMMLSAKIVMRPSAPPENMLNMPRMPPGLAVKMSARTAVSMPGSGM